MGAMEDPMQNESFSMVAGLPDPKHTTMDWDAPCSATGWPNMVTNGYAADVHFPRHHGPLSIKCAFNGTEVYNVKHASFQVTERSYLILNDGQQYESRIDEEGADSFCVFFRPGYPEEVLRDLITPEDRLLDNPITRLSETSVAFFEKLYPHDQIVSPILSALYQNAKRGGGSELWLAEQFYGLLDGMLHLHRDVCREIDRLPAVRRSTRIERYRRLQRAKEFMDAYYRESLTVPEIASAACLSTHHFLRLFKEVFGITPYRYIMQRRLEEARRLLLKTDLPVSTICYDIGFESPGSFSWLFRRQIGMSPAAYRAGRRDVRPS